MRGDVTDSGIMRVLSKICDIVCLNVLWLVCSLPIITIGASTTALYTVMLKLVKNEEGYIFKGFLHAFKLIYSFALTARYENTIGATLKNALLLTVAKLPYTILMTALTVGAVVLSWWNTGILMLTIPVWILAGTGILAFINSCILRRVFRVFDEKAEGGDEEERTDMEE